jgi:hypothetical protein
VIALIGGAAAAIADTLIYDGDIVVVGVQTEVDLGTVSPGAMIHQTIRVSLVCDTKRHADPGTTVIVRQGPASSAPPGGSITMPNVVFNIPNDWPSDNNACPSPAPRLDQTQTVTIVAPTTPGSYTYELALVREVSAGTPGDVKDPDPPKLRFKLTVQAPANRDPTVTVDHATVTVDEGALATNTGTYSDPDGDPVSLSASVGQVTAGAGTWSWSFQTIDGPAQSQEVTITADDGKGGTGSASFQLIVNNVPPVADFTATSPIDEGSSSTLAFTNAFDPSLADTSAGFRYAFACDGNTDNLPTSYGDAGDSASASCLFQDNGSFIVAGRIFDKDNGSSTYLQTVQVKNVPPAVSVSLDQTVDCRKEARLTFSFSDPGVNDGEWSVEISWGDGNTDSFSVDTQGEQDPVTHVYTLPGTYTVTVTVTDKDGGVGEANGSITVEQVYAVDFLPPFDDSSPSGLIVNTMKNGRVVPVKATIFDVCRASYVNDPTTEVTIKVSKTNGDGIPDPVEEYADAGQSSAGTNRFRWTTDSSVPGGGFWIYNLDSKALGLVVGTRYRVDIYVGPNWATLATRDTWAVLQPVK